jgi:hypothetical protein
MMRNPTLGDTLPFGSDHGRVMTAPTTYINEMPYFSNAWAFLSAAPPGLYSNDEKVIWTPPMPFVARGLTLGFPKPGPYSGGSGASILVEAWDTSLVPAGIWIPLMDLTEVILAYGRGEFTQTFLFNKEILTEKIRISGVLRYNIFKSLF